MKSDRADELLRELRGLTGSTVSDMMWQLTEFRRKYPEFATSDFRAENLYDEDGLPR